MKTLDEQFRDVARAVHRARREFEAEPSYATMDKFLAAIENYGGAARVWCATKLNSGEIEAADTIVEALPYIN